jgi:hypothetical protein
MQIGKYEFWFYVVCETKVDICERSYSSILNILFVSLTRPPITYFCEYLKMATYVSISMKKHGPKLVSSEHYTI